MLKSKFYVVMLILGIFALLGGSCTKPTSTPPSPEVLAEEGFAFPEIPRITCEELKQKMDRGDDFVLVDTRPERNFKGGYLEGAINIPNEPNPPLTEGWVKNKLLDIPKDKLIVFYCG